MPNATMTNADMPSPFIIRDSSLIRHSEFVIDSCGVPRGVFGFWKAASRMWSWLFRWRRRRVALGHLHFTFYTRAGCHLCEAAWHLLQQEKQRCALHLAAVDVVCDPALVQLYGDCVPVVAVNGKVRFRGQVNEVLLDRLLRAEANRK